MKTQTPYLAALLTAAAVVDAFTPSAVAHRATRARILQSAAGNDASSFNNDGPFAFMQPSLEIMGIAEGQGKAIVNGVFTAPIDESTAPPIEERLKLRDEAAKNLRNIGMTERERRNQIGTIATYVSAAYVVWASLIADEGGFGGHLLRFLAIVPIFAAAGYKTSAKEGLCNIGQAGIWDVDGTGLSAIPDKSLAQDILERVNKMNIEIGTRVSVPVVLFALLPSSTSHALVSIALAGVVLYALRDKLPQNGY